MKCGMLGNKEKEQMNSLLFFDTGFQRQLAQISDHDMLFQGDFYCEFTK